MPGVEDSVAEKQCKEKKRGSGQESGRVWGFCLFACSFTFCSISRDLDILNTDERT